MLTDRANSQALNDIWLQFSMVKLVFHPETNLYIFNNVWLNTDYFFDIGVSNAVLFDMNDAIVNEYIDSGIHFHFPPGKNVLS